MGTDKNEIKAFKTYREAAELGNLDSSYKFGKCYQLYGIRTEKDGTKTF